jgi:hypothetical protein
VTVINHDAKVHKTTNKLAKVTTVVSTEKYSLKRNVYRLAKNTVELTTEKVLQEKGIPRNRWDASTQAQTARIIWVLCNLSGYLPTYALAPPF